MLICYLFGLEKTTKELSVGIVRISWSKAHPSTADARGFNIVALNLF